MKGYIISKREFRPHYFHYVIETFEGKVIDTIWLDNLVAPPNTSGQYVRQGNLADFELKEYELRGRVILRLMNVQLISLETLENKLNYKHILINFKNENKIGSRETSL